MLRILSEGVCDDRGEVEALALIFDGHSCRSRSMGNAA